ncbi:hypothetical protein [Halovenus amylolytica]|uniref:hypothetical protein n=1 Tax=Halovenus amylolytica TaxID=2500550 RepID=UPI003D6B6500
MGYRAQVEKGIDLVKNVRPHMQELALGGTATVTGLNTHPEFPERMTHQGILGDN